MCSIIRSFAYIVNGITIITRVWANAQRDVALPNIDGVLCSMPQSLADAHYLTAVQ